MLELPVLHEEFQKALKEGIDIRNRYLKGFYMLLAYTLIMIGAAYMAHTYTNTLVNLIVALVVMGAQALLLYSLFILREALKDHRDLIKEIETYQRSFTLASLMSDFGITANVILVIFYSVGRILAYVGRTNSYIYDMIFLLALSLSFIIFFSLIYFALFRFTKNILFLLAYISFLPLFPIEAYLRYIVHVGKMSVEKGTMIGLTIGFFLWWLNLVLWKYAYIVAYKTYRGGERINP
jgi:hypothetical protein